MTAILKRENSLICFFADKRGLMTSINGVILIQKLKGERIFRGGRYLPPPWAQTGGFFAWAHSDLVFICYTQSNVQHMDQSICLY